MRSMKDQNFTL